MKKLICLCLVSAIAAIAIWAFPVKISGHSYKKELSRTLGLDVKSAQVLEEYDSHGGFHGDGVLFAALQFQDNSAETQIAADSFWRSLPLSPSLTTLAYGSGGVIRSGPYLSGKDGSSLLPDVKTGWYFFFDRHSQSKDPYDETQVMNRHSFNFTLAIYDADTDILYYIKFDT